MIQKMYKGYYIRKKLKIYYNLPRDLQRKIIWHINSDLYLRNYNSSISKLIYRRYTEYYVKYIHITSNNTLNIYSNSAVFNTAYNDLMSLVKLSIKYYLIMNINKIPFLYNILLLCSSTHERLFINNPNDPGTVILKRYMYIFSS